MNINRCVAIICCLLVSFTTSSKAASSSEEQFLSDISSIKLPGDPPPSVRKGSSESSDNTINHSQPSVSSIKNNTSHQGHEHEDVLKKENRMLRQRIASLQNKLSKKQQVARAPMVPSQAQEHLSQDNTELMKKNASLVAQEKDLNQQISSLQVQQSEMYKTISLQEKALFLAQQNLSLTQHSVNKDRDENSLHQQITLLQKSLKENQISRVKEAQSLQAQLETLSKQNAELTAKNDTLSADGEKLRQQMSARDTQLTGSQKAAAEAAAALQAKLDTLSKQNAELTAKNDTLSADGEKLRQQMSARDTQLTGSQKAAAEAAAALQAKLDTLSKQNAELTAKNDTLSADGEKLRQQMSARDTQLTGSQKAAAEAAAALQAKLDTLSKQNAELTAKNDTLSADGEKLRQQMSARDTQLTGSQKAAAEAAAALQAKLDTLSKQNAELTAKNDTLSADGEKLRQQMSARDTQLTGSQKAAAEAAAALQAKLDTLSKQNAELTAKNDTLSADGEKLRQQMSARDTQLTGSQKAAAEAAAALQAKLDTLSKQNAELTAKNDTLSADGEKLRQQLETLQQELNDNQTSRAEEVKTLQVKVDALNKQNMALTANPSTPSDSNKAISLDTPLQQHSYTLGAILAEDTRARVKESSAMGIDIDKGIMLTGLQDGYNGHLRIDKDKLKSISDEMNHVATSALKKEADSGKKRLDKAVVGKTILDQKGGVVVVLDKKGRSEYNKGDKVIFDSIEKIVGGKSIVNSYNNKITYTDNMSFMLKSAVEGGKKGGQVTLYGFAGNIYTPSSLPEGVKVDTPVQVSLHLH